MARRVDGMNLREIRGTLQAAVKNVSAAAGERGVRRAALVLERHVKRQLSKKGTGRVNLRKIVRHADRTEINGRRSAPGQPPAVDTGRLRSSVGTERVGLAAYRVGTPVDYAPILEFGGVAGFARLAAIEKRVKAGGRRFGYVAARPFMRPALEAARAEMTREMSAGLVDAVQLTRG